MGKAKIAAYFTAIKEAGKNLFVPYIVAGDTAGSSSLETLNERITFLEESGVAAIELGIPFSDPVADGPTIQRAGLRALEAGVTLEKVLNVLEETKTRRNVPIIIMTYFNPIFAFGVEKFASRCQAVGVDGVIIPDVPMEEEDEIAAHLQANDIAFIRLVALTSTPERKKTLATRSEGFLYAVAVTGTTGARTTHEPEVEEYLQTLKQYSNVPVLAGFGVSNPEQAKQLSAYGDGVIVGSKIVDLFAEGKDEEVRTLIKESL